MAYTLRSRGHSSNQDRDDGSQRKRLRQSERKAKYIKPEKTEEIEVINIDADPETQNNGCAENENDNAANVSHGQRPDTLIEHSSHIWESSCSAAGKGKNVTDPDTTMKYSSSHMETDFYNFDKDRNTKQFLEGQVWAIYDDYGLPRRYVKIDLISSSADSFYVTFLKHNSLSPGKAEQQNFKEPSWFRPACGYFTPYSKGLNISPYSFSHKVCHQFKVRSGEWGYNVYPRKGEVWAIYKDGNRNCSPRFQKYQLVDILNDFSGNRVKAVYLVKAGGGYHSIYKRLTKDDVEVSVQIGQDDLNWFSHQIPAVRIVNTKDCLLDGCLEVDPASLPLCVDIVQDTMEPRLSSEFLRLRILDCKSLMLKEKLGESIIWAVYDDRGGLPRKYALIENIAGREVMTWLEPCPMSKDETKWYKAGLPIACGNFRLKKSILTIDYCMLSHPTQYDWESCNQLYSIYPRKGEVWGIYRDWEMGWSLCPGRSGEESNFEYDIVQILTDFSKNEGVQVVNLANVESFSCLFQRRTNDIASSTSFVIPGSEIYRFSHQIHHCKIQRSGTIDDVCLLLDPFVGFPYAIMNSSPLEDPKDMDLEANKKDCSKFLPEQVWALYEDPDRMPRSYAIVRNTFPNELKVEVTMLKPHPMCEEEMEWVDKNLPISCGTFHADKVTTLKEVSEFSHEVILGEEDKKRKSFYKIIPQRGEVWAVYQNWEHGNLEPRQYRMVEITSSFDTEFGLNVAPLFEVSGARKIFRRHLIKGFELVKRIPKKEMLQFSHQVQALRINKEGDEMQKGRWMLESSAIPSELTQS